MAKNNKHNLNELKALYAKRGQEARVDFDDYEQLEQIGGLVVDKVRGDVGDLSQEPSRRIEAEERRALGSDHAEAEERDLLWNPKAYLEAVAQDGVATALAEEALAELAKQRKAKDGDASLEVLTRFAGADALRRLAQPALLVDGLEGSDDVLFWTARNLEGVMHRASTLAFKELRARSSRRLRKLEKVLAPTADQLWTSAVNSWLAEFDGERDGMDLELDYVDDAATGWRGEASDMEVAMGLKLLHKAMFSLWLMVDHVRTGDPASVPAEGFGYARFNQGGKWVAYPDMDDAYRAWLVDLEAWIESQEARKRKARTAMQGMYAAALG